MAVDYMLLLYTRMHRVLTNHRELSWLLVFVETTPSHLHHYPGKAGMGGVYDCDLAKGCQTQSFLNKGSKWPPVFT